MAFTLSDLNDEVQLRRKLVLTPCASKDGLRRWIRTYLKFDCPDVKMDDDSTGSPMDTIWEIYRAGVTNDDKAPSRFMWYASRDSFKTLGAAVLELLAMLHMKRSVVHLAAILQQSEKAQEYYKTFLDMGDLSEFKVGDNKRTVAVLWFEHLPTGNIYTLKEWKDLGGRAIKRGDYRRHVHYVKTIVNTPRSANSDHVAFMVIDEVDLIQFPKAYREALFIPTTIKDEDNVNQPPITLLTSSRKYPGGLVQEEIDNAEERGTVIRHHNIFDVTARCPDDRHEPSRERLKVYRSNETLKTILPSDYQTLLQADPKIAETYVADEASYGCFHNCKIFAACRGRMVHQTSDAAALKPVYDTIRKFKGVGDPEMVKAQLLCWKPGNSGAIYSTFSRTTHMLSLDRVWEEVTGEVPFRPVSKSELIAMFAARGFPSVGGMDHGFTHCFAVTVGFVVGERLYIIDAFEIPGLEPHQCVEICDRRIKYLNPLLWPDTAYPAYIKMFRSAGYRCREHKKDVVGGIEAVRKKLSPVGMDPEFYLIKGDEGCELLAKRIEGYRWREDSTGRPTDVPLDIDDDLCDALRYMVQPTFEKGSGVIITKEIDASLIPNGNPTLPTPSQQMVDKIAELTDGTVGDTITPGRVIKKRGFFASFD